MPMDKIISDEQILTDAGFYWRERGGVKALICRPLEEAGFVNAFSTRSGGVSDFPENSLNLAGFDEDTAANIEENRRRFLGVIGGEYALMTAWQIHSDRVKLVETFEEGTGSDEKSDALVSKMAGGVVGVKTADCVPILIGDPGSGAFAAVHAGWRGTALSIVSKAIGVMRDSLSADPERMVAAIGPAAGRRNYEIGPEVTEAFETEFADAAKYFKMTRPGHALIDLHQANADQLTAAGVSPSKIFKAPLCTMERTDLFFSYRVEKSKFGKVGRLLSVIGQKNTD